MGVIGAKSLFCESQQCRPGRHTEQRRHTVGQACPLPLKEHRSSGNTWGSHALRVGTGHLESVREEAPQIYLATSKPHTCLPILTALSITLAPDFPQPILRPLTASAPQISIEPLHSLRAVPLPGWLVMGCWGAGQNDPTSCQLVCPGRISPQNSPSESMGKWTKSDKKRGLGVHKYGM